VTFPASCADGEGGNTYESGWTEIIMVAATKLDPAANIETWEVTGEFTVWVWKHDVRHPGHMEKQRAGGKAGGSKRLRLTTDERRYNEEQVVEENKDLNPFTNGQLKLVDGGKMPLDDIDQTYHWGDEQYSAFFEIRDVDLFKEQAEEIASELILRRLYMIGEKTATIEQREVLKEIIEVRYKAGGTQGTVQEILNDEAKLGKTISGFN
jgi:hypothetical protein